MAKHSVNGGTGRLFTARKSGFGVSALYRIKPLLQNISHPEPGDFRGLQEIEVSPARGNITSPEGTKFGQDPPAEIPGSPGTGVYQSDSKNPPEHFKSNLLIAPQICGQNNHIIQVVGGIKTKRRANVMAVQNTGRELQQVR